MRIYLMRQYSFGYRNYYTEGTTEGLYEIGFWKCVEYNNEEEITIYSGYYKNEGEVGKWCYNDGLNSYYL